MMKKILLMSLIGLRCLVANINWDPAITLSSATVDVTDPQISIDSSGNYVVLWIENNSVHARAYNGAWGADDLISTGVSSDPKLVCDETTGDFIAVWIDAGFVTTRTYTGGSWSSAQTLSATSGTASLSIAIDSTGNMAAAWVESSSIKVKRKPVSGSWGTVATLGTSTADQPVIGVGNAEVSVVWHQVNSGFDEIISATAPDMTSAFGSQLRISLGGTNNAYPKLAANNDGNALACWFQYEKNGTAFNNVYLMSAYLLSGTSWSNPAYVNPSNKSVVDPQTLASKIVLDQNGNGILMWTSNPTGGLYNLQCYKWNFTNLFTQLSSRVLYNLASNSFDVAASKSGYTPITQMYYDFSNILIQAVDTMTFDSQLLNFTPAVQISDINTNNANPVVTASDDGSTVYAATAWIGFDGFFTVIQTSKGSDQLVAAPTISSVVQANTSYDVYTNNYNTVTWTAVSGVIGYNIYRNEVFIGQVDSSTLSYVDNNQLTGVDGTVKYGIAAIGNNYFQSVITEYVFTPP